MTETIHGGACSPLDPNNNGGTMAESLTSRLDNIASELSSHGMHARAQAVREAITELDKQYSVPPGPPNVSEEVWRDYVAHRKAKRAKLTQRAIQLLCKKIAELSQDQADRCLELSIENGWTGVFPQQVETGNAQRSGQSERNLGAAERVRRANAD